MSAIVAAVRAEIVFLANERDGYLSQQSWLLKQSDGRPTDGSEREGGKVKMLQARIDSLEAALLAEAVAA